ncbi:MAG TPA: hypothetical protein VF420_13290 [Casimicrobiaceae bacterium]
MTPPTIVRALDNFDDETEARLCAFLNQAEGARKAGAILGWRIQVGNSNPDAPAASCVAVLLPSFERVESSADTLSEAIAGLGAELVRTATTGAPKA